MQSRLIHLGLLSAITAITIFFAISLKGEEYYMVSICLLAIILLAFFMGFEKKIRMRDMLVIIVMSSIAVVSRIAFFFLPQVKPLLAISIITGTALGPMAGFSTGAISVFLSNFYFGQGPYTPFQMVAAGLVGYLGGVFFYYHHKNRWLVTIYGILSAIILYGFIVDLNTVFLTGRNLTWDFVLGIYAMAFPLNLIHGISTGGFLFFLYRPILQRLERIQKKYGLD